MGWVGVMVFRWVKFASKLFNDHVICLDDYVILISDFGVIVNNKREIKIHFQ